MAEVTTIETEANCWERMAAIRQRIHLEEDRERRKGLKIEGTSTSTRSIREYLYGIEKQCGKATCSIFTYYRDS